MPYFIFKDDTDSADDIQFWNRRERRWQGYLTKSCVYSSRRGAEPVARRLFNTETDHFRPGEDWLGFHCLADFHRNGCRKSRIRF